MIYLYKGAKGKGKTLTMVKDAYLFHLEGKKVYSNMKSVKFAEYIPNEEILKIDKNNSLKNCVLLIDELQTLFNARRSAKKQNLEFSFFIQQIRKRGVELLATSQYSNTTDLLFRQHIDYIVMPKFDKELNVCMAEYIDLNSLEDNLTGEINMTVKIVFNGEEIFGLYNTNELIV